MKLLGKLISNDSWKIGMISSTSKYIIINFSEQYFKIPTNKDILNDLKGIIKIQKR